MMMHWGNGMSDGSMMMTAGNLVIWGLIIAVVVVLVRRTGSRAPAAGMPTPQQVLADRFARGQIDEEQYARQLAVLSEAGAPPVRPRG